MQRFRFFPRALGPARLFVLFLLLAPLLVAWSAPALRGGEALLPVTRFDAQDATQEVPRGWHLLHRSGRPVMRVVPEGNRYVLHLESDAQSAFGIERDVQVNVAEYPYLTWRWKVCKLPRGGDVRRADADDQAIQVYVAFPAVGFPERFKTPAVGYLWDSEAPVGLSTRSPQRFLHYIRCVVLRNKNDQVDTWITEKRNLREDYRRLFRDVRGGTPTGKTVGLRLYINSQHTCSEAESWIGDIAFARS